MSEKPVNDNWDYPDNVVPISSAVSQARKDRIRVQKILDLIKNIRFDSLVCENFVKEIKSCFEKQPELAEQSLVSNVNETAYMLMEIKSDLDQFEKLYNEITVPFCMGDDSSEDVDESEKVLGSIQSNVSQIKTILKKGHGVLGLSDKTKSPCDVG